MRLPMQFKPTRLFRFKALMVVVLGLTVSSGLVLPGSLNKSAKYVIVAWNNLGMHCYDGDFSVFGILPPYNVLWAQAIQVGDPPRIVTDGFSIKYDFPDNTYSAGVWGRPDKTNFWTYAQTLFRLPKPLPPNVGLNGKRLSDFMDPQGDHFIAEGIPLTEFRDQDAVTGSRYPFQLARISLTKTGAPKIPTSVLTSLTVVAPVSSELNCVNCHADGGDATTRYPIRPTGNVKGNILVLHDYLSLNGYQSSYPAPGTPLSARTPVLCAECHASNALGAPGVAGISSLSNAMHRHHNPTNAPDITPDTAGCYNCHPGPQTQCLRGTMSQHFALNCTNCHGQMIDVAANPNPWLSEPRCDNAACHGPSYAPDQPLYRESRGHGGIYCAGCHDSPHAYVPSREANDGIKFVQLQGHTGTLRECTVCHLTKPTTMFNHMRAPAR